MSRYKRKYLSKTIQNNIGYDIFRNKRIYTISPSAQLSSDILGFSDLTQWGVNLNALSIYDFKDGAKSAKSDVQGNNANIIMGDQASISSTDLNGLFGYISINATANALGVGSIPNVEFGRTRDRTLVLVGRLPVNDFALDYIGGPGTSDDSFIQASFNDDVAFDRAVISPYVPVDFNVQYRPWLQKTDTNILSITMIRWDHTNTRYSITYKVLGGEIQDTSLSYLAGTNNGDTFYIGAIGGKATSTAGTQFYWIGFFDQHLNIEEFEIASRILGI